MSKKKNYSDAEAKLEEARQLIMQGRYTDAEAILLLTDHPTVPKLLERIETARALNANRPTGFLKQDYVAHAFVILIAYVTTWIVGLLLNIHFLRQSRQYQLHSDYTVRGRTCLQLLLLVGGLGPFILVFLLVAVSLVDNV